MDRHTDLTDNRVFSTKSIPKFIRFKRMPWNDIIQHDIKVPWLKHKNSCERCGADIKQVPWDNTVPFLCQRCAGILSVKQQVPWEDIPLQDGYVDIFLAEFMNQRR